MSCTWQVGPPGARPRPLGCELPLLWPCPASGAGQMPMEQHSARVVPAALLEGKGWALGRQEPQGDSRQFSGHGPWT